MTELFQDHYKTLQVDPEAEPEVIAAAYRRLAAKYHPDICPTPEAAERMVALNLAYDVLSDPGRRAEYHVRWQRRQLHRADRPEPARGPARPGHYPSARPVTRPEPPPTPTPTLVVTPPVLDFGRVRRGHCPTLTVQLGVTDGGTVEAQVRGTQPWVLCQPDTIKGSRDRVDVNIDTSYLEDRGRHRASLVLDTAAHGACEVPIYLYLLAAPTPYVMLTPTALDFGAVRVGSEPPSLPVRVLNGGRGTLEGLAAARVPWLSVEPAAFRGNRVDLRVFAHVDDLAPGRDYVGQVDVSSNGGDATAMVTAFVLGPARLASPWRDETPADQLFLRHRASFLSSLTHPTARQMTELELVEFLQGHCRGGDVSRTLQRAIARLQRFPFAEDGVDTPAPTGIPLAVLDDVFQRLRRWEAYRG